MVGAMLVDGWGNVGTMYVVDVITPLVLWWTGDRSGGKDRLYGISPHSQLIQSKGQRGTEAILCYAVYLNIYYLTMH